MIKRLRWVMVFVILFDFANTLIGQPSSFWQHPETMNEHNRLVHSIAAYGVWAVIVFMLLYTLGAFLLVSLARQRVGLVALFAFILCDFHGAAAWIERHWGFGNTGFVVYGILLAAVIVLVGFSSGKEKADA